MALSPVSSVLDFEHDLRSLNANSSNATHNNNNNITNRSGTTNWTSFSLSSIGRYARENILGVFFASIIIISLLYILYAFGSHVLSILLGLLDGSAAGIRDLGTVPSVLVLSLIVFSTCFPFTMGYSIAMYYCGFVLGFPWGWIPGFIGALAGAICCFVLVQRFLKDYVKKHWGGNSLFLGMQRAIGRKGWPMLLLIRLAPWPFALTTTFMAVIPGVQLGPFVLATALSLLKLFWHVYLGSSVQSLSHIHKGPTGGGDGDVSAQVTKQLVPLFVGTGLVFVSTYFVIISVRREMQEMEQDQLMAREEEMRSSDNQAGITTSAGGPVEFIEMSNLDSERSTSNTSPFGGAGEEDRLLIVNTTKEGKKKIKGDHQF